MFESDDWTFEDNFDDIVERAVQSRPLRQNEEEPASVKRRKVDSCNFPSFVANDAPKLGLDAATGTVSSDPCSSNKSNVSRGNLLLGIFQETASNQETTDPTKETSKGSSSLSREIPCVQSSKAKTTSITSHYKESKGKNVKSKAEPSKKVKLVRIFPGPAGLVPDTKSNSVPAASSCLNSEIELENKSSKCVEVNLSKSQDERNLYDDKAWKLLLDDLPNDFFTEYGISAIKSRANTSNCDSMRVKFVAGVIDYVDHGRDDPLIVLKDSTGSIEATVHRDIALNYPGVLEPNMVVLLRDVGLLKTVTYVVTNKYHVLVSKTGLLAVYSNKGRIASTACVEDVLSSISASRPDGEQLCTPISGRSAATGLQRTDCDNAMPLQSTSYTSVSGTKCSEQIAGRSTDNSKTAAGSIFEDLSHSMSMDDFDDFFAVDCEFTSSAQQNCPDRSKTVPRTSEIRRNESQARCAGHLENTKKDSTIHCEDKSANRTQDSSQTLRERVAGVDTRERPCENRGARRDSNSSVKSRTAWTTRHNQENTKNLLNCFAGDNKYDSDDEFLSQLDIDSISGF